jgi:hypothetical protein
VNLTIGRPADFTTILAFFLDENLLYYYIAKFAN